MPTGASEADRHYYRYVLYCRECDQVLGGCQTREELDAWPREHPHEHRIEIRTEAPA